MAATSLKRLSLIVGIMACTASAWAGPNDPYVGYVYPAGGQQATTFRVTIRGQRLRGASEAYVSGKGVRGTVVDYESAQGPLDRLQQEELKRRLQEIRDTRLGRQPGAGKQGKAKAAKAPDAGQTGPVTLPDLPELRNLDQMTPKQLQRIVEKFLSPAKRTKPPMAELVTLDITVDSNAAPGDRELRLRNGTGLSNPVVFQVGQIPEIRERTKDEEDLGALPVLKPPVVLNGQIMPGEVDRFPLQLVGGQKLVVAAQARKLIPYLADAVPGWFQAIVALYDANGKQLICDDDCGFDPDPAFVFRVPSDGQYTLEIRDAIYRGREDFVYRVDVGDETLIKSLFPLGGRGGVPMGAGRMDKDVCSKLAEEHFQPSGGPLPQCSEVEPNETGQTSMRVKLPQIISGGISKPGDKDVFAIEGHAGDAVVAEVYARRMGSPLDSLLRLIDTSGRVVASNDDHEDVESGLLTHQADSYISAKLPASGRYFVQLTDAQRHGGPEYCYELRVSPPQPDFALRMTPSTLNVSAGRSVIATVCAVRKDGWDGDIKVVLKGGDSEIPTQLVSGLTLNGAVIPKGRDKVRMTLTATRGTAGEPVALRVEGRAQIGGKTVTRPAIAADNLMQAFAYYHLVPAEQLMLTVSRGGLISPSLDMPAGERLRIPAGGTAQVSFGMRVMPNSPIKLELSDPPPGVTLQDVTITRGGVTLTLKADDKHTGYADNLIVEAFTSVDAKGKAGAAGKTQRVSAGVLPAIPFEIVQK